MTVPTQSRGRPLPAWQIDGPAAVGPILDPTRVATNRGRCSLTTNSTEGSNLLSSLDNAALRSGFPRIGNTSGLPRPPRISDARRVRETRYSRFVFVRRAGMVRTPWYRSVSVHEVPRTSPPRAAVRTRSSNAKWRFDSRMLAPEMGQPTPAGSAWDIPAP